MVTAQEALGIALRILAERYPDALAGIAAGSILRGEGVSLADLDLVVLRAHVNHAWRESFHFAGLPVEALVHDGGTLEWFLQADIKRGRPAILAMVAEGQLIGPDHATAQYWQERARNLFAAGPSELTAPEVDALRYEITALVDDLRGIRPIGELIAIGATLYPRMAELSLRGRKAWFGSGKWLQRRLAICDLNLAQRYEAAFADLFTGGSALAVVDLAEAELGPHGGYLFAGFAHAAPSEWTLESSKP